LQVLGVNQRAKFEWQKTFDFSKITSLGPAQSGWEMGLRHSFLQQISELHRCQGIHLRRAPFVCVKKSSAKKMGETIG